MKNKTEIESKQKSKKSVKNVKSNKAVAEVTVKKGASKNDGKCCTCRHYGKPCSKTGQYRPRKADGCKSYKHR